VVRTLSGRAWVSMVRSQSNPAFPGHLGAPLS
jgi:hypothetical protein